MEKIKVSFTEFYMANLDRAESEVKARGLSQDGLMASIAFGAKVHALIREWYEDEIS
jgi:hypothetical protein